MLYAIRNKKTGRLLTVEPGSRKDSDWGYDGVDERRVDYTVLYLWLQDSEYPGVVFATSEEDTVNDLLTEGKSTTRDIERIDFGWGTSAFTLADLERVELRQ